MPPACSSPSPLYPDKPGVCRQHDFKIKRGEVPSTNLFNPVIISSRFQKKLHHRSPVVARLKAMADDVLHIITNHLETALGQLFYRGRTHPFKSHPEFFILNNKARLGSPCRGEPSSKSLHIFVVFTDCIISFSSAGYNSS